MSVLLIALAFLVITSKYWNFGLVGIILKSVLNACLLPLILSVSSTLIAQPIIQLPRAGLEPQDLAIVFLKNNEESAAIARYYQQKRNIPSENLVAVEFSGKNQTVEPGVFAVQKRVVDASLPDHIQAYALAWTQPFRVGCMGMTAAFALGYNVAYCASGCEKTRRSPYHHTTSTRPFDDFDIRPAMMLAGESQASVRALIDRGVMSDDSQPQASALLMRTSDKNRNVRQVYYPEFLKDFSDRLKIEVVEANEVYGRDKLLYYFTGIKEVKGLETLGFLPGAIADHLTSHGGSLVNSSQMSAVKWLEAGATASFGNAHEPCNFLEKFPDPRLVARYYLRGNTAIEAYWKSVAMPGQGNFVGEPLAKPFRGYRMLKVEKHWELVSPVFYPGYYEIYGGALFGEQLLGTRLIRRGEKKISIASPFAQSYRIERKVH